MQTGMVGQCQITNIRDGSYQCQQLDKPAVSFPVEQVDDCQDHQNGHDTPERTMGQEMKWKNHAQIAEEGSEDSGEGIGSHISVDTFFDISCHIVESIQMQDRRCQQPFAGPGQGISGKPANAAFQQKPKAGLEFRQDAVFEGHTADNQKRDGEGQGFRGQKIEEGSDNSENQTEPDQVSFFLKLWIEQDGQDTGDQHTQHDDGMLYRKRSDEKRI